MPFFLGDVTNSHFDDNQVTNVASQLLFNLYGALSDTTIDGNDLTNTAGLVGVYANVSGGVEINDNVIQWTTFEYAGSAAINVDTYIGQTITGVDIKSNQITAVSNGIGINIATDGGGSISDVNVQGNTINDTADYGIQLLSARAIPLAARRRVRWKT